MQLPANNRWRGRERLVVTRGGCGKTYAPAALIGTLLGGLNITVRPQCWPRYILYNA